MDTRYILTRTLAVILLIVLALYGLSFMKKRNRLSSIVSELKSLSSESSYFRQFSREDAEKSLIRAVGLIAEAGKLGLDPENSISRALGVEEKYFNSDDEEKLSFREQLIRANLRANYENFRKLGYNTDFHTLQTLADGELPPLPTGSVGGAAEVGTIIDPEFSPGIDTVLANLEIRPRREKGTPMTDVETAIALKLARDLEDANVIESSALERIRAKLTGEDKTKE